MRQREGRINGMSAKRVFIGGQVDKQLKADFVRRCTSEIVHNGRSIKISQNELLLIFLTEGVEMRLKARSGASLPQRIAR